MNSRERAAIIVQDLLTMARRDVYTAKVVDLNETIKDFLRTPEYEKLCSFHPRVRVKKELEEDLLRIKGSYEGDDTDALHMVAFRISRLLRQPYISG